MLLIDDYDPIEGLPVLIMAMRDAKNSNRGCEVAADIDRYLRVHFPLLQLNGARNSEYVISVPNVNVRSDDVNIYGGNEAISIRHSYHNRQGHLELVPYKLTRHVSGVDIFYRNYYEITKQEFENLKQFCDE